MIRADIWCTAAVVPNIAVTDSKPRFRESNTADLQLSFDVRENIRRIHDFSTHNRQQRRRAANLVHGDGHEIPVENCEVGELAGL